MENHKVTSGLKLYEQVLEQIKGMIARGTYQKGDLLPSEKELMNMMGVSRITVREALRLLSEAGVIETHKGKGSYVLIDSAELAPQGESLKEYCQSFLHSTDARLLLEPAIAREVARTASPEEVAHLGACIQAPHPEDSFHRALIAATHNPILIQWFDQLVHLETDPTLSTLVPPARQKSVSALIEQQHQKVFEAIRDRKDEFAYFYMKEHLEFVRETYLSYFEVFY
ncbi:transcriptional regulator [Flavonifractor sp. An92]|uniref:FadR/GntR family transcriptional regulator n=1 Tax=Flavonifractor sp. An92 TaxID=1965666 RepID=UPI000B37221D|nr:FadR/GntR family transcriptional regulator [Flavonifractor sp. An92]OUN02487.1 transcriptional regulator [Flavonifractor sp. An92]